MTSDTISTVTRIATIPVALALAVLLSVAIGSPARAEPLAGSASGDGDYDPPAMCSVHKDGYHEVYSTVRNTSDDDMLHRIVVDDTVIIEYDVPSGWTHTYRQHVPITAEAGPTYAAIAETPETGESHGFWYRHYHIALVMDPC